MMAPLKPGIKPIRKIKVWCVDCNNDYFIYNHWEGSECPHCGYWNKKIEDFI